jgi:hypothetical protein
MILSSLGPGAGWQDDPQPEKKYDPAALMHRVFRPKLRRPFSGLVIELILEYESVHYKEDSPRSTPSSGNVP